MGFFDSKSSTSLNYDQRSYQDSFNTASNPTLAASDTGNVNLVIQPAPAEGIVAKVAASVDPRLLVTAGLIALAFLWWRFLR